MNKKQTGIRNQIQKPLIIFIVLLILCSAILSIILVFGVSYKVAMKRAADQARSAAAIMREYKALPGLTKFWFENRDDFEKIYDVRQITVLEEEFRDHYPQYVLLTDVTNDEFNLMSEDDKRLYAEVCFGRISKEYDKIKRYFAPQYLYSCLVVDDKIYFMITGSLENELRVSQGGDLFELGSTLDYIWGVWPNLDKALKNHSSAKITNGTDFDSGRSAAFSWETIDCGETGVMFTGASEMYEEVAKQSLPTFSILLALILVAFACLEIWVMRLLKTNVVRPVEREEKIIIDYMDNKDADSASERLKNIKSGNELEALALNFSSMIEELKRYIEEIRSVTAEKERMGAELNVARQIQYNILPHTFPPFPDRKEFELYASMEPAREVGGDFYDFYMIDDDHIALVIGDVSGKGVPASIFMAISKTIIRNTSGLSKTPGQIFDITNNALSNGNDENMFVTAWLAIIDLKNGEAVSANAGHEHPVIRRADGVYEKDIYSHDIVMGVMDEIDPYKERRFKLNPGDSLFVYTDGVPDAINSEGKFFSEDSMMSVLNENPEASAEETIKHMRTSIETFVGEADRFDDVTMLSFKYFGPGKKD